ncbi:MAG: class I SAM-dependent methyltransferase [Xanthobacteraceae bacterium]
MLKSALGSLHKTVIFERRARVLAERIGSLLPPHASVLDVGTGNGQIARRWAAMRSDISVAGIDVLVRGNTEIPVRAFDGYTIPYADKSVDAVTFVDVLHHSSNPQQLLSEAARVARHAVVIKDHLAESSLDHAVLRVMDWVGNAPHGVVLPYNYLPRARWRELFQKANLSSRSFSTNVPLYPAPLNLLFGRHLHFIADLWPALS